MSPSKNAKKRQQAQRAQQRRQATAGAPTSGAAKPTKAERALAKQVAEEFGPDSTSPIEPTGSSSASVPSPVEDDDGPGFTPVRRGAANTVIIALVVAAMVVAVLVLVVR